MRELQVLGRITERGKTVRLLRRLSARENKWYRAHWRAEAEVAEVRKTLGIGANFNMRQLNRDYRKALEVRSLRNSIRNEKAKIRELNQGSTMEFDGNTTTTPQVGMKSKIKTGVGLG